MITINFPNEWVESTLAEICFLNPKNTLSDDSDVGFLPMNGVPKNFGEKNIFEVKKWSEVKKGYTHFSDGDTIFAKITPCFENGKASIIEKFPNGHGSGSTEYFVLRPIGNYVNAKLLLALVRTNEFLREGAANMSGSVGHKRVPKEFVENFIFPLAPLAEQQQIAQKLDELLSQVDTLKTRLDVIPKILKRFRQSVLAAAVSGRLTDRECEFKSVSVGAPWSHEVSGSPHWTQHRFSDVVKIIGGSQPPKSYFTEVESAETIRLIQIRDYKSDKYKIFIPRALAKRFCTKDEIMIGRYGPPIFQILRKLNGAYNVALMKAEPNEKYIYREYLYWFLQNYKLFNYIEAGSDRTAGQSGVNKSFLESYPIFLPPLEEQTEIVRRVVQLFAYADQIEQRIKDAKSRVNHLTQSILAKAFRGELTAEWRVQNPDLISGENSAAALLERIKAEREATATSKVKMKKK